ncbi:glycerophosphodiester phosphodiesterase [Gracilimonas tropica]|uniref:glycerophosphodiester phosphodiesterase n=1 Tax=Gracilimonas tropica TaxID=454600 RepID=UPI000370A201|nr:glycerophosphodiester phosphodiesterase family protein [Gracilimonas tropica]
MDHSFEPLVKLYNDNGDGFTVIAHRGASAYYPENTMSAFKAALEMGAEMIEADVSLSKDGVPVVIHDEELRRTTNGSGLVSDHTVEELKRLDAGAWFGQAHAGEQIPTLEELLTLATGKIALNIEIKPEAVGKTPFGGIEEKVVSLVEQYGMRDYVLYSSFAYKAIKHFHEINVDIPVALLYDKKQSSGRRLTQLVADYDADAFNCSYWQYSKKWAEEAKEAQIPIFVYTVNDERKMRKVIQRGASGIFTDKPDVLKHLVDNMWKTK